MPEYPELEGLFEGLPEEELTEKHQQIIDAAIKVFAEKGFEGSKTRDIAREANVAEGTIFRYFRTKKDLLVGLLLPLIVKFFRPLIFSSVERIINQDEQSMDDILTQIFVDRVALARKNQPLLKTVLTEAQFHPELLKPLKEQVAPQLVPLIDGLFEEKMRDGTLRSLDPRLVTRTAMSLVLGYLLLTSALPEVFPIDSDEEEGQRMADILLRGIGND